MKRARLLRTGLFPHQSSSANRRRRAMYSVNDPIPQQDFVRFVRPNRPALVAIFADASFCPKSGAVGWGAWAKRDTWGRGKFMGGPIRREIRNSTEAELCGIAAAIWQLNSEGLITDAAAFVVQCDNLA